MDQVNRRTRKIYRKPENMRNFSEKFQVIDKKYQQKEKLYYEEFVLLSFVYDNVYFVYNNVEYQIDHGLPNLTSLFIIEFDENKKKTSEREEKFPSGIELLNKAKIDGKSIKEIWENVTFR